MSDDASLDKPVFRFAPSPNGQLHLGHALSALTCARLASEYGGRFFVRLEDIDTARCRQMYADQILDDLEWLGVAWEEPVLRQSDRFDVYDAAAQKLIERGLLYPCFASRKEISEAVHARNAAALQDDFKDGDDPAVHSGDHIGAGSVNGLDPDGAPLYPGLHKHLSADAISAFRRQGRDSAMRIDMAAAIAMLKSATGSDQLTFETFGNPGLHRSSLGSLNHQREMLTADPSRWGDAIIQRKDVPTSYHLSVVVDDAAQGVTHVVRGRDLLAATDLQRLLQWLLGFQPPVYLHHRVLFDPLGRKMSKTARSTALRALREDGVSAWDIKRRLGFA